MALDTTTMGAQLAQHPCLDSFLATSAPTSLGPPSTRIYLNISNEDSFAEVSRFLSCFASRQVTKMLNTACRLQKRFRRRAAATSLMARLYEFMAPSK